MRAVQQLRRFFRVNAQKSTTPQQASAQPPPQVTLDDVERVVCRDFPASEYGVVMAMVGEYGTEKRHREPVRVQLAALKVANGSVQKLRACLEAAKRDYRDALAAAEYPAYCKLGFRTRELPAEERRRIIDSDWQQYQEWLKR